MLFKRLFKTLYQGFNNLSLQNKLVVLYITLFMVPVIIIVIIYSNEFYKNMIADTTRENEYLMEMERIHINKNIETMRESAQIFASDDNIIEFVSNRREKTVDELIEFQKEHIFNMEKIQSVNPIIDYSRFFIDDPSLNEMWPILLREDRIKGNPWLREVKQQSGKELWWLKDEDYDPLSNIKDDNPKISLYRKVNDSQGNHLGIIEISMLQRNFFPKMYTPISDGQSEMLLVNQKGLFRNPAKTFLKDQKFSQDDLSEMLDKLNSKESMNSFLFTNGGIPYLIVANFIDDIDTYMVNVISLEDSYSEMRKVRNVTIIMAIVLLLLLSLVTYIMISLLLKKMYKLIDNMKQVEKGDFTTNIQIEGRDEFATLAFHFRNMLRKINKLIADAVNKQAVTKDTELRALKTQIDSHFLYNTLENIKMMAEIDGKYEISDSLTSLGSMMRYNIKWKTDFVVLSEEITHIKNYVNIMNLRLDQKLSLQVKISNELLDQEILKLSLQPIVENAIKHGIEPNRMTKQGIIKVEAYTESQFVYVEITDNGVGMNEEQLVALNEKICSIDYQQEVPSITGNGIGLKNVNERISLFYGKEFGLNVKSVKDVYTTVVIKLPYLIIRGAGKNV